MAFTPAPRVKNALDERKLGMSAPCPADKTKKSSLMYGLFSNNPRITVYTNDPADQGNEYGKITAKIDAMVFAAYIQLIKDAIAAPGEFSTKIENKNFTFFGGKRSDEPAVVSELMVGKDKEGVVWVAVMAKGRPKIKFPFGLTDFHRLIKSDGSEYTAAETSVLAARAMVSIMENLMPVMIANNYVEPPKKDAPRGGGNYNNGGNRNGGNQQRSVPVTDVDDSDVW